MLFSMKLERLVSVSLGFGLDIFISVPFYLSSLSGCPLNAQSIKRKLSGDEMMTIKLKTSSGV